MKKRLLAVLLAGTMAFAIAGCGGEEPQQPTGGDESGTTQESTGGDESSTTQEEGYMYSLQARGADEATLLITYADGTVEETDSQGWFGDGSQTYKEMMEEWDIVSVEAKCGDAPFLGWVGYEVISQVDENGFEDFVETPIIMHKQYYTTEDLLSEILPESDVVYYTVFEYECGGCEESKACDVYYIDDGVYYVCGDCYEEFATGMGLN